MKSMKAALFACAFCGAAAMAQTNTWDATGNSQLSGNYYFRQVVYGNSVAYAVYGGITFDGNGGWTIAGTGGQMLSTNTGAPQAFSATGTYAISSAGFGYLTSPADATERVFVMVSNGIIVGSATENTGQYSDLFVAAPIGNPQPTVASLNGTYQLSYFRPDFTTGASYDEDALIQMSANGAGQANTSMTGYYGGSGTQVYTQISPGLKYYFSNGAGVLAFPGNNNASFIGFNGQQNEYIYMSPDGNFLFGGSPLDFDFFVGVKTNGSNPSNFSGLFYQAGMDDNANNNGALDSWYGSFDVLTGGLSGNIISNERVGYGSGGTGYTFPDTYGTFTSGGYTNTTSALQYVFSPNGAIRIGFGLSPYLGLNVALQAPSPTGTGVWLNPQGVTNSASSAPFTAGISNGELITLYGSNLASGTVVANSLPWPTSLGSVSRVSINGYSAPIYFVSPNQISVVVPYENTFAVADIQVITTSGATSNVISVPVYKTTPGVFTIDSSFGGVGPGGLGFAAAEHGGGAIVSNADPAQPGETIQMYLTGLGNVNPSNPDGAAGPISPFSIPNATISIDVNGTAVATPLPFIGLAPALAGLYQIDFQIPTTLTPGNYLVGITGPDSYSDEAVIPVGTATSQLAGGASPRAAASPSMRIPNRPAFTVVRPRATGQERHPHEF